MNIKALLSHIALISQPAIEIKPSDNQVQFLYELWAENIASFSTNPTYYTELPSIIQLLNQNLGSFQFSAQLYSASLNQQQGWQLLTDTINLLDNITKFTLDNAMCGEAGVVTITNNVKSFIQKKPVNSFTLGSTIVIDNNNSITFNTALSLQNYTCLNVHYYSILNNPPFWTNLTDDKVVVSSITRIRMRNQNDEHIDNLQIPMQIKLPLRYRLQTSNTLPSASCVTFDNSTLSWTNTSAQVISINDNYILCSFADRGLVSVIASKNEVIIDDPFAPYYSCGDGVCQTTIENCANCPDDCGKCAISQGLIIGVSVGGAAVILIVIGFVWYRKRKPKNDNLKQKYSLLSATDREEE